MKREFFVDTKRNPKTYSSTRSRSWKNVKQRKNGGKNEKRTKKKQRKQITSGRFFSPTNNFIVGNYGPRRAERWDDMPSISSEVGEI